MGAGEGTSRALRLIELLILSKIIGDAAVGHWMLLSLFQLPQ